MRSEGRRENPSKERDLIGAKLKVLFRDELSAWTVMRYSGRLFNFPR